MKKYYYILLIFMGLFSSCELEMIPEDTMSPETYFNSAKQLEMWCNGYYTQLEEAASVAASNADDNIDNQLGDVLMGQRSAADESAWTWTMLRKIIKYLWKNLTNEGK